MAGSPATGDDTAVGISVLGTCAGNDDEDGVAFDREEAYEGLTCVAVPLRSTGRAIAAVSVTGPTVRFDTDAIVPAVQQTAVAIWTERFATY